MEEQVLLTSFNTSIVLVTHLAFVPESLTYLIESIALLIVELH